MKTISKTTVVNSPDLAAIESPKVSMEKLMAAASNRWHALGNDRAQAMVTAELLGFLRSRAWTQDIGLTNSEVLLPDLITQLNASNTRYSNYS